MLQPAIGVSGRSIGTKSRRYPSTVPLPVKVSGPESTPQTASLAVHNFTLRCRTYSGAATHLLASTVVLVIIDSVLFSRGLTVT